MANMSNKKTIFQFAVLNRQNSLLIATLAIIFFFILMFALSDDMRSRKFLPYNNEAVTIGLSVENSNIPNLQNAKQIRPDYIHIPAKFISESRLCIRNMSINSINYPTSTFGSHEQESTIVILGPSVSDADNQLFTSGNTPRMDVSYGG